MTSPLSNPSSASRKRDERIARLSERNGTEFDSDRQAWHSYLRDVPCRHDHLSEDFAWDCYMERGANV